MSFHFCTGPPCRSGGDENHGGGPVKNRSDHDWHPQLYLVRTGPGGFEYSGNRFGNIVVCGNLETGEHPNVEFQQRRSICWEGLATAWYDEILCDCSHNGTGCPSVPSNTDPPGIPGYGLHDLNGAPPCTEDYRKRSGGSQADRDGLDCECTPSGFSVCQVDAAWVAVDLNLDGTGKPYRSYAGLSGNDPPYQGEGIPRLRDYDMTKNPNVWNHNCPSETWTNEMECSY